MPSLHDALMDLWKAQRAIRGQLPALQADLGDPQAALFAFKELERLIAIAEECGRKGGAANAANQAKR